MVQSGVNIKEPFLTGFSSHLFGSAKRREQESFRKRRQQMRVKSLSEFSVQFDSLLPAEFLDELSKTRRKNTFCDVTTFWAWAGQMLELNASCSQAVSFVQASCAESGLPMPSSQTGAYCTARKRLGEDFITSASQRLADTMERRVRPEDHWRGMTVKSIDGSSTQLEDNEANQEEYPQSSGQAPGCGFPIMKFAAVLDHSHMGWSGHVTGSTDRADTQLAHELLDHFQEGDLCLADRAFCSYELIAQLLGRGSQCVMRLHQTRAKNFTLRQGKKIGSKERLVTWQRPIRRPRGSSLSRQEWENLPEKLVMRLIVFEYRDRTGKKKRMILATTLLDPLEYPWEAIAQLYLERWEIELRLRDVKTTMGLEALKVKTPEMARKSLAMGLLAYNLVRATAQDSAITEGLEVRQISFKGCLDTLRSMRMLFAGRWRQTCRCLELYGKMLEVIATKLIDFRPDRWDPRLKKKRPKPFGWLKKRRSQYKQEYLDAAPSAI